VQAEVEGGAALLRVWRWPARGGGGMDPEQTFLRVHARLSGMLSQLLTRRIRLALEYLYLAGAVALFCLLVVMHTNFVQQVSRRPALPGIAPGGLPSLFYCSCLLLPLPLL